MKTLAYVAYIVMEEDLSQEKHLKITRIQENL